MSNSTNYQPGDVVQVTTNGGPIIGLVVGVNQGGTVNTFDVEYQFKYHQHMYVMRIGPELMTMLWESSMVTP